jgi:hypothetical protein
MRNYCSVALGVLLYAAAAALPARADSELIGKWVGQFNGVQIAIPAEPGPFGYLHEGVQTAQTSKYVEKPLRLDIESQKKELMIGTWASGSGEFKKRFVCAQTSQLVWNCIDSGGRASVEVTSPTEIKVCYFDHREGALGAGCAILRKS